MKKQFIIISLSTTLTLTTTLTLAQTQTQSCTYQDCSLDFIPSNSNTAPSSLANGVCIFDIDNTLKAKSTSFKGPRIGSSGAYLSAYAQQAVYQCIKHRFGVAINTAYNKLPTKDKGRQEFLEQLLAKNSNFASDFSKAIYQDFMHGADGPHAIYMANKDSGYKKAQAMSDIMQSYFGTKNTSWLTNNKDKSKCAVLFDDNANNRAAVLQYDKEHDLQFLAQDVDGNTGITQSSFDASFNKLLQTCMPK